MRTKALKPRVMVRIKEVDLYRFIILFFIIFLSACTAGRENSRFSISELFNSEQEEWLSLLPTEELMSINEKNKPQSENQEIDNNDRVMKLRKKAQELSSYEFKGVVLQLTF